MHPAVKTAKRARDAIKKDFFITLPNVSVIIRITVIHTGSIQAGGITADRKDFLSHLESQHLDFR